MDKKIWMITKEAMKRVSKSELWVLYEKAGEVGQIRPYKKNQSYKKNQ